MDYIEATRVALDEALVVLETDEREERESLIVKATGMRDELQDISALIRSKGIITQEEKEQAIDKKMQSDIQEAISYVEEVE